MNTKEYLQQIYIIRRKISRLRQRIDIIEAELYTAKTTKMQPDRVMTSHAADDKMLTLIAKKDRLASDIRREIQVLYAKRAKIMHEVEQVPDEQLRQLLTERYELCHTWEQIAVNMDLSVRYVYMLHGKALSAFDKIRK